MSFSPQKVQKDFQVMIQRLNNSMKQAMMLTLLDCASFPWLISWVPMVSFPNLLPGAVRSCLLHTEFILHSSGSFLSPPKNHVSARSKLIEPFFNK